MAAPVDSILPSSYFTAVSDLWSACTFLASVIAGAGFSILAATSAWRRNPVQLLWLIFKAVFIGLAIISLRDWLLRLNDVIEAFNGKLGVDPATIANEYLDKVKGLTGDPKSSIWDIIWKTGSVGTAIAYALIWIFGWIAWGAQYFVRLIGDVLLTMGWALSPIFLAFFLLRPMTGVARRFITGLVAVTCWPFGWAIAAVVTKALLDAAAAASLTPVLMPGDAIGPVVVALLVGLWILVSAPLAPYILTRVLLMGANPAAAMFGAAGGVAQAAMAGGVGAATTAATAGAAAPVVIAAAVAGGAAATSESAARGGRSGSATATMMNGASSFFGGRIASENMKANRAQAAASVVRAAAAHDEAQTSRDKAKAANKFAEAHRNMATAHQYAAEGINRAATAQEKMAAAFSQSSHRAKRASAHSYHADQPHEENPDQMADIIARRARSHLTLNT